MDEYLNSFQKLEFDKVKSYIQRYTISDLGREHVEKLTPGTDLKEIRLDLAAVTEFKRLLELEDPPPLRTSSTFVETCTVPRSRTSSSRPRSFIEFRC